MPRKFSRNLSPAKIKENKVIRGGSAPRSDPLPFDIPFLVEKIPLSYTFHWKIMKGPLKYLNDRFPYPFIYLKREKGILFGRRRPVWATLRSTPPLPLREKHNIQFFFFLKTIRISPVVILENSPQRRESASKLRVWSS